MRQTKAHMRAVLFLFFLSLFSVRTSLASTPSPCESLHRAPHVHLQQCGKLKVLYLEGTPLERARANGALLGPVLSTKVIDYFADKVFDGVPDRRWQGLFALVYNQVVRLLHRAAPASLAEELDAQATAMGTDPIRLRRAITLPDTISLLNALGSLAPFRGLPAAGCTSAASVSPAGDFIYGRNLDFAGAELWDQHPLVTVILPPAGSTELKHAVFGADGLHFGGITGVNEAGVTFAVHQNYTREGGVTGVPMVFLGELVLRSARNLEEAEAILREHRPATMWTFVLTELTTGRAITVETSRNHFSTRSLADGSLVQTNHLMNSDTQPAEFISVGTKMNSVYRMKEAFAALDGGAARALDPAGMAALLSRQAEPTGELAAYHDVLKGHTVQTVIFHAPEGKAPVVYVSADAAPTASGAYVSFPLGDLWRGRDSLTFETADLTRTPPAKRERQREISRAFHTYLDLHAPLAAAKILEAHRTLDAALLRAVAHYQTGRAEEAVALADQALANPRFTGEPAYILQSVRWVKLAALLKLGRADEARRLAESLRDEGPANARLKELSEAVAAGRSPPGRLLALTFEFFSGDLSGRPN